MNNNELQIERNQNDIIQNTKYRYKKNVCVDIGKRSLKILNIPNRIVQDMISLYEMGWSTYKIADEYEYHQSEIYDTLKNKNVEFRDNSHKKRLYSLDENYFKTINSHEKAQILGLFYADGCNMRHPEKGKYTFGLSLTESDKDYLKIILKSMRSNIKLKRGVKYKSDKFERKPYYYFRIYNKQFCDDLHKLGCVEKKSLILDFPTGKIVSSIYLSSFLLGYFEGDGGLSFCKKKNSFSLSLCGTKNFCNKFKEIIYSKLCISSNIYPNRAKLSKVNSYIICISGNEKIKKLLDWLYSNKSFYMKRKYILYKKLCKIVKLMKKKKFKSKILSDNIINDSKTGLSINKIVKKRQVSRKWVSVIRRKRRNEWKT